MSCTQRPGYPCNNCGSCGLPNPPYNPPCPPPRPVNVPQCSDSSLYYQVQKLEREVHGLGAKTCGVLAKAEEALKHIKCAAVDNGAFYTPKEVWTEEGYSANDSSTYTIIHKKHVAINGSPIRMEMRLAYNNTTNSLLKEDAFTAAEAEYANISIPAVPVDDSIGWFGHVYWKGAPVQTNYLGGAYTAGFSKSGKLKWYNNSVDKDQLRKDNIQNAMGVYGILVAGGSITDESMRNDIPMYDQRSARVCIGQNYETMEVIILVCGQYDTNGLTSLECANILRQYGCSEAVEVCQGSTSSAIDKGQMLFTPTDGANPAVPTAYAYWYITKKRDYTQSFTWEIAALTLKYGRAAWEAKINSAAISDIYEQIAILNNRQTATDAEILEIKNRLAELQASLDQWAAFSQDLADQLKALEQKVTELTEQLTDEVGNLTESIKEVNARVYKEIADRESEIARLEGLISDLESGTNDSIEDLQTQIDNIRSLISDHETRIQQLRTELTQLQNTVQTQYTTVTELIAALRDDVGSLQIITADLSKQLAALDTTLSNYIATLTQLETAVNNIKNQLLDINSQLIDHDNRITANEEAIVELKNSIELIQLQYTTLKGRVDSLENQITALSEQMASLDQTVNQWIQTIITIETTMNEVKQTVLQLQTIINNIEKGIISITYRDVTYPELDQFASFLAEEQDLQDERLEALEAGGVIPSDVYIPYRGESRSLADFGEFLADEQDAQDARISNTETSISNIIDGTTPIPGAGTAEIDYRDVHYANLNDFGSALAIEQNLQDDSITGLSNRVTAIENGGGGSAEFTKQVYVSEDGDDVTGDGSAANPAKTVTGAIYNNPGFREYNVSGPSNGNVISLGTISITGVIINVQCSAVIDVTTSLINCDISFSYPLKIANGTLSLSSCNVTFGSILFENGYNGSIQGSRSNLNFYQGIVYQEKADSNPPFNTNLGSIVFSDTIVGIEDLNRLANVSNGYILCKEVHKPFVNAPLIITE